MSDQNTLEVRLGKTDENEQLLDDIRALERGEDVPDRHVLLLEDESYLQRLLSPTNLALLRAIREHEPGSMRQAAELVDRDIKDVHRNLTELETLNVVEFEQDGRSKRPVVRFDEIDIELSLEETDSDSDAAAA